MLLKSNSLDVFSLVSSNDEYTINSLNLKISFSCVRVKYKLCATIKSVGRRKRTSFWVYRYSLKFSDTLARLTKNSILFA